VISAGRLPIDVHAVNVAAGGVVAIEDLAAGTFHPDAARFARLPFEGRDALPGIPKSVLLRGPVAVVSPGLKSPPRWCFARKIRHAASKDLRASQKLAAVPEVQSPGSEPG